MAREVTIRRRYEGAIKRVAFPFDRKKSMRVLGEFGSLGEVDFSEVRDGFSADLLLALSARGFLQLHVRQVELARPITHEDAVYQAAARIAFKILENPREALIANDPDMKLVSENVPSEAKYLSGLWCAMRYQSLVCTPRQLEITVEEEASFRVKEERIFGAACEFLEPLSAEHSCASYLLSGLCRLQGSRAKLPSMSPIVMFSRVVWGNEEAKNSFGKSREYLSVAAGKNHPLALYERGVARMKEGKKVEALKYLVASARGGNLAALARVPELSESKQDLERIDGALKELIRSIEDIETYATIEETYNAIQKKHGQYHVLQWLGVAPNEMSRFAGGMALNREQMQRYHEMMKEDTLLAFFCNPAEAMPSDVADHIARIFFSGVTDKRVESFVRRLDTQRLEAANLKEVRITIGP